ncbi:MAG: hypothetical protein ACRD20_12575 [Terriglobales bacterium]
MTRLLPAILLMLAASRACGSTVNLSWGYDYTGLQVCSATVTKNCLDHFEMNDATSGTPVLIAPVQNPSNASDKVTAITGTFQTSSLGQRTFAVTAVGRDNAGNLISSDWTKCQGTFQVPPSPPSSLSGSVQ